MSTIFTLTSPQWEDLVQRMHGEGVLRPALYRDDTGAIGVAGRVEDMILFLTHVAELVEDLDDSPIGAMEHLRYFVDQVDLRDQTWWLPCVRAPKAEAAPYRSMGQLLDDQAQRRVTRPRTWCDAECTFHKFHNADGTPTDYDGNPIPVDRPFPAREPPPTYNTGTEGNPPMACTLSDCPGVLLNQPHDVGDNECGYLNAEPPKPKSTGSPTTCRRPNCASDFMTAESRLKHETTPTTKHLRHGMDFICDWQGHADAIDEAGFCPVCQ